MISLSHMQQSRFRGVGSHDDFPLIMSLQVLEFSAQLEKTEYFYLQPRAVG